MEYQQLPNVLFTFFSNVSSVLTYCGYDTPQISIIYYTNWYIIQIVMIELGTKA